MGMNVARYSKTSIRVDIGYQKYDNGKLQTGISQKNLSASRSAKVIDVSVNDSEEQLH